MAVTFSGAYIGSNQIRWTFSGMTFDRSQYFFHVDLSNGYSETWDGADFLPSTTTNHNPGDVVTGTGQIEYKPQGFYQTTNSSTVTVPGGPPPPPSPPGPPSSISVTPAAGKHLNVSWGASSGTVDYYQVWTMNVNPSGPNNLKGTTSGTSLQVSVEQEYTIYQVQVFATNSGGNSSSVQTTQRTYDETPPTVSATFQPSANTITVNWNANDPLPSGGGYASGINYVDIMCSGPGGGSVALARREFSASGSVVLDVDSANHPFQPNTSYTFQIVAVDTYAPGAGNQGVYTATVTTLGHPAPFAWTYAKVQGGNFNLTAVEWNSFMVRVNDFRQFKNLASYTWSANQSFAAGDYFRAAQFNEVRTAIQAMTPPTALPASVSTGGRVLGSQLNGLRDSLNSIT